jgi:hypothetical protein
LKKEKKNKKKKIVLLGKEKPMRPYSDPNGNKTHLKNHASNNFLNLLLIQTMWIVPMLKDMPVDANKPK